MKAVLIAIYFKFYALILDLENHFILGLIAVVYFGQGARRKTVVQKLPKTRVFTA
jgi:hypothetical protein